MNADLIQQLIAFIIIYVMILLLFAYFIRSKEKKYADISKTEFTYMVTHQLMTPLTLIRWLSDDLLNKKSKNVSQEAKHEIKDIQRTSESMIVLVNRLLTLSKLEKKKLEIHLEETNLTQIVDQVINENRPLTKQKNIKICFSHKKDLPMVKVDRELMKEVYSILINNAIKFSSKSKEINITHMLYKKRFIILVEDHGSGIEKQDQKRLFTKYFRGHNSGNNAAGTGIGLYFAKLIIKSFGGEISVQSTPNKGTTVQVTLKALRGI